MKFSCLAILIFSAISLMADTPDPAAKPIQLQFMQSDVVQKDLLGNVQSIDEKSYVIANGVKGANKDRSLNTYNAQGCALEQSSWDGNGNLKKKTVTTYDAQGNFLKSETRDTSNAVVSIDTVTFDPVAKKTTTDTKTADGSQLERSICNFDDFGKEHDSVDYDGQGNVTGKCTMERNFQGKEITVVFYGKDGQKRTTITVKWNPDGTQAAESFSEDEKGITTVVTYDYPDHDSHGNWTTRNKRTVFEKGAENIGESNSVSERVITYY